MIAPVGLFAVALTDLTESAGVPPGRGTAASGVIASGLVEELALLGTAVVYVATGVAVAA